MGWCLGWANGTTNATEQQTNDNFNDKAQQTRSEKELIVFFLISFPANLVKTHTRLPRALRRDERCDEISSPKLERSTVSAARGRRNTATTSRILRPLKWNDLLERQLLKITRLQTLFIHHDIIETSRIFWGGFWVLEEEWMGWCLGWANGTTNATEQQTNDNFNDKAQQTRSEKELIVRVQRHTVQRERRIERGRASRSHEPNAGNVRKETGDGTKEGGECLIWFSCLQPLSFLFCLLFCFDFFEASLGLVLLLLIVDFFDLFDALSGDIRFFVLESSEVCISKKYVMMLLF